MIHNRPSLLGKYFNLMLIIQNVLLEWFDEWQKSTRSPANGGMAHGTLFMGSGVGAWGTGIPSYRNLTMADDNMPA